MAIKYVDDYINIEGKTTVNNICYSDSRNIQKLRERKKKSF